MAEHTPTPWVEVGSHDFRGADMALVGMVNPTVKQGKVDRAFIVKAANSHDALVKALEAACGYLTNAKIDLQTGCTKATAIKTIDGGLKLLREALAKVSA